MSMTKRICAALLLLTTTVLAQERSVRISFVPPPLDGTISLGIYDENDQLVRVLHQEAELDEFTVGPDALVTKWDGKDDYGYDSPAGKYSARGFLVAPMKIDELSSIDVQPPGATQSVRIKLVANPLDNNDRPTIELTVGFDDENAFLKSADGLPLVTIAKANDIKTAFLVNDSDRKIMVVLDSGSRTRRISISGLSKMMGFDCGEFELR